MATDPESACAVFASPDLEAIIIALSRLSIDPPLVSPSHH
jgi:hypothetical protein